MSRDDTERAKTLIIPFEKTINFGKSSGGKQEENHLRKLDTLNEISRKNYFTKSIEEKSFTTFEIIARGEFYKRKSTFETLFRSTDGNRKKLKKILKTDKVPEKEPTFESSQCDDVHVNQFINDLSKRRDECVTREKEMKQKLKEIHHLIIRMQSIAEKKIFEGRDSSKFVSRPDGENKLLFEKAEPLNFETSSKLKRKLIPTHFSSTFTTDLESGRKTFAEKIFFRPASFLDFSGEKKTFLINNEY